MARRAFPCIILVVAVLLAGCSRGTDIAPTVIIAPSSAAPGATATVGRVGPGTTDNTPRAATPGTPSALGTPGVSGTPIAAAPCSPGSVSPVLLPTLPTTATRTATPAARTPAPTATLAPPSPGATGVAYRFWQGFEVEGTLSTAQIDLSPDGATAAVPLFTRIMLVDVAAQRQRSISTGDHEVVRVRFSPDGQTILSSGRDKRTLILWDVATGAPRRTITAPGDLTTLPQFQPGGTLLAAATADGIIRLWDLTNGQERLQFQDTSQVSDVAFTADGRTLGTTHDKQRINLWSVATGQKRTVAAPGAASLAFSPDGATIATGADDGTLALLDAATGQRRWSKSAGRSLPTPLAFIPDGKTLLSGNYGSALRVWDAATGALRQEISSATNNSFGLGDNGRIVVTAAPKVLRFFILSDRAERLSLPQPIEPLQIAYSPDGCHLAIADTGSIRLYNPATGVLTRTIDGPDSNINTFAISPDSTLLATGDTRGRVQVWEIASGRELRTFTGTARNILTVAFSPDGRTLVASAGTVTAWDLATGAERFTRSLNDTVYALAFTPNGRSLLVAGDFDTIVLLDPSTGSTQRSLAFSGSTSVGALAVSPDGFAFASAEENDIAIWDLARGEIAYRIPHAATSLFFHPDGGTLVANRTSGPVILWDLKTGAERNRLLAHWQTVTAVAFSPDGRALASGSTDATVRLWDIAPLLAAPPAPLAAPSSNVQGPVRSFPGHTAIVDRVAYSPDGSLLASGSFDQTIRVWETATGTLRYVLRGHKSRVVPLAFSPDGRTLASGEDDEVDIILWDLDTGKERRRIKGDIIGISELAFSLDGRALFVQDSLTTYLYDLATDQVVRTYGTSSPYAMALSPDGTILATSDGDQALLWRVADGAPVGTLPGYNFDLAFSPDGRYLAGASGEDEIVVWDVPGLTAVQTLTLPEGYTEPEVYAVAFSPDSRTLATDGGAGRVILWDTATWTPRQILTLHDDTIDVAYNPTGTAIASSGHDGTVKITTLTPPTP